MNKKTVFPIIIAILAITVLIININQYMQKEPKNPLLSEGMKSPDFELIDINNNSRLSLKNLQGKVVLLNFWASWCNPCREEIPSLHNLKKMMAQNSNFKMITVVFNEKPAVSTDYLKRFGYDLPVYFDPNGRAAVNFGLTGVPETYIINKDGIISKIKIGPDAWDSKSNVNLLTRLMQ